MEEEKNINENSSQQDTSGEEIVEVYEPLSKTDAMAGILTEPGDTYQAIAQIGRKNYWLLPTLILVIVATISAAILTTNDEFISNGLKQQNEMAVESMKEKGMSQEKIDEAMQQSAGIMKTTFMISYYFRSVFMPFIALFFLALVYFLFMKGFKAHADYVELLNVVGLAFTISIIQELVTLALSYLYGDLQTLSLGLVFSNEQVGYTVSQFVKAFDVFSFWFYSVIAIGLSRIGRMPLGKSIAIVFGFWIGIITIMTFGLSALF